EAAVSAAAEGLVAEHLAAVAEQVAAPERDQLLASGQWLGEVKEERAVGRRGVCGARRSGPRVRDVEGALVVPRELVGAAPGRAAVVVGQDGDRVGVGLGRERLAAA